MLRRRPLPFPPSSPPFFLPFLCLPLSRLLLFVLPLLLLPTPSVAGDRTFTITNSCTESIWTAITTYDTTISEYAGPRGFEQVSGNTTTVTVPSPWNGRIWPRRSCTFDEDGTGSCLTGDCSGKLECDDGTIGVVNVGEFNLDSYDGLDFWDQSCVPGWTIPMSITPEGDGCDSVSCTQDVNAVCPDDRMKVQDDDGNTLACIAACFAGINATDPSMNCCSGIYNSLDACISSEVDYYSVLKPLCENAYWYPYDSRDGSPTVDFTCSADGDPGYTIEYCPDGVGTGTTADGTSSSSGSSTTTTAATTMTSSSSGEETTVDAEATTTAVTATGKTMGTAAGTSGKGEEATSTAKQATTSDSFASLTKSSSSIKTSATTTASSSASSSSSPTTSSSSSSTILGLSRPLFLALCAALLVFLLVLGVFCALHNRHPRTTSTAAGGGSRGGAETDEVESSSEGSSGSGSGSSSDSEGEAKTEIAGVRGTAEERAKSAARRCLREGNGETRKRGGLYLRDW